MTTFFTIITATYNSEKTFSKSLESILNQTFSDFEIVIVDGNSKDKTIEIANSYKDPRIKVFSEPDEGLYDAFNKGIRYAKGEWIYFLGSDDYLYDNDVLLTISKKLNKDKNDVVYGNVLIQGNTGWAKDGQIYNGEFSFQKLLKSNICHQSIFYRRSFVLKHRLLYDLKYPISADWDFTIACRLLTKFTYTNIIVAIFSAGGISTNASSDNEPFINDRKIRYAHLYKKYRPSIIKRLKFRITSLVKKFFNSFFY